MRTRVLALIFAGASTLVAAMPADAVICYVVYNRSENVIYQDTYPPVDMSRAGTQAREAMERRGEHLTFGDIPQCPQLTFLSGSGGIDDMGVDAVLAELPGSGGIKGMAITGKVPPRGTATATPASSGAAPSTAPASKPMKGAY